MKYYKLHVIGSTSAGTVIGKDGKPLYTENEEVIKQEELAMQDNKIILAVDSSNIVSRQNTLVKGNFAADNTLVKDYDLSFTIHDDVPVTVATVRLSEGAMQKLYENIGQKLKETKVDHE